VSKSTEQALLAYPSAQVSALPNGLRVATEPSHGDTATVGVWIDTGSRYESKETNGVAHFLEHMFFKGTAKRTRQQLEMEVENMGGHLNAYTSREQTVFYAQVDKSKVPQAMDILADIIQNSQYSEQSIEAERDVILRERQEVEGQQEEVIFDRLHETAYRGTALGRTILGDVANINSITRDHIKDYISTHYVAPRMVVAGAGAVEHKDLLDLAGNLFGGVPAEGPKQPYMEPAKFTGSDIRVYYDSMPEAHIAYAFPTAGWCDSDNFPLLLIQTLLGNWDKRSTGGVHSSSWLISEVASKDLAHSISPFNTQYSDTGLFGVYATCDAIGQYDLMYAITEALTSLCYNVDEDLLAAAKNRLKAGMLLQTDGSAAVCEELGRQILTYGRRLHPLETLQRIEDVDSAAIKACAKRFFYDRDPALAAIGPLHELPDYNWLRRRTYWLRY